jgi:hypothetical protein
MIVESYIRISGVHLAYETEEANRKADAGQDGRGIARRVGVNRLRQEHQRQRSNQDRDSRMDQPSIGAL